MISHNYKFINTIFHKFVCMKNINILNFVVDNFDNIDLTFNNYASLGMILEYAHYDTFVIIEHLLIDIDINYLQNKLLRLFMGQISSQDDKIKLITRIIDNFPIKLELEYYYGGLQTHQKNFIKFLFKLYGEIIIPDNIFNKFISNYRKYLVNNFPQICPTIENV